MACRYSGLPVLLVERVLAAIRQKALIPHGGRLLAAVSGGGDSVALLYLLAELSGQGAITLAGVAHLNHRLRRPDSDDDERFCRELAARLGLPFIVEVVAVDELARARRISLEHAGHRARYAFFDRAAGSVDAYGVALGHTIDDQAETFLLRLLRGAGAAGLSAMRPRSGRIIRPLLGVTRAELRDYLALRRALFRDDESNSDLTIARNRIRHDLLPHLRRYSPKIVEVLAREAEIARADGEWLASVASRQGVELVSRVEGGVEVDAAGLAALPVAVARLVARDMLVRVSGSEAVSFEQIERLRQLAADGPRRADFRRCRAERIADIIRLVTREGRGDRTSTPSFVYRLQVPGEVSVPEAGVAISAQPAEAGRSFSLDLSARSQVVTVAASVARPLTVRSWQPGDWFRPLGLDGHRKKLQDLFVDRKVNRAERTRIPLVLDDLDRIIWVVGQSVSNDFRVTEGAVSVLVLKARPLGDNL